ncbi:MAG TPA: FlgD immunoglobulin-like domain containing protein [Spirochaetota bacterium]|nr:FlgD immunoglobulin-like domain containing protein [Spirochaetota bacterium]
MKKLKTFAALLVLVIISFASVNAYDMKDVVVGPVPFNPKKDMILNIRNPQLYNLEISIYDINGDIVYTKSGSTNPVIWNGRDGNGRHVKPGLYIIKVIAENAAGNYGKKVIRILVDY